VGKIFYALLLFTGGRSHGPKFIGGFTLSSYSLVADRGAGCASIARSFFFQKSVLDQGFIVYRVVGKDDLQSVSPRAAMLRLVQGLANGKPCG
jgi:hypothetical protein